MRTVPDIVYAERQGTPLALDLYLPEGPATATVFHAHGGGFFKGGRKGERTTRFAKMLTAEGLAMAAVSYSLGTPMQEFTPSIRQQIKNNRRRSQNEGLTLANRLMGSAYEAARQDIGAAMDHMRDIGQQFEIKSKKQAVIGISAGGIAGLSLAFPPSNMPTCARPDVVIALGAALLHPWALSQTGPQCLMIHSHYDRVIAPSNASLAGQAAQDTKAPLTVLTCARKGHNAPAQALLDDDAPDGTSYWSVMLDLFRDAGLFSPSRADV
ncbi:MAG: hypothetical protein GY883_12680 [Shimia sp.]|nr:hypothetical protein [Shimia sp.]